MINMSVADHLVEITLVEKVGLDPKFSHWKPSSESSSSSSRCETEEELLLNKGVDRCTSPSSINNLTLFSISS
uniref:Uncharacterized protein n=1 Tax=Noccaea caerulescens TaxID=107243 RepID=A0A1J3EUQ1_NOCCA